MGNLIIVEDSINDFGPCGVCGCTVDFIVCEFCEGGYYVKVDYIESITCEDSDEPVPFTISGEIGKVEYEGVSMLEAATHYIVSCKLKRNKKESK